DEDRDFDAEFAEALERPDAVVAGHAQVQQHHVGAGRGDDVEGGASVVGLADHFDVGDLQQGADALAYEGLVVDDHDAGHVAGTRAVTRKPSRPSMLTSPSRASNRSTRPRSPLPSTGAVAPRPSSVAVRRTTSPSVAMSIHSSRASACRIVLVTISCTARTSAAVCSSPGRTSGATSIDTSRPGRSRTMPR